ncbi:MAG: M10 family metallopeptidase C-terminal domain-containing protein [Defluviicoccus sp.]
MLKANLSVNAKLFIFNANWSGGIAAFEGKSNIASVPIATKTYTTSADEFIVPIRMRYEIPMAIFGSEAGEYLAGTDYGDKIYGPGGNDTLKGSAGNDYLDGGPGDDRLNGGTGQNVISGGADIDTVSYLETSEIRAGVFVDLATGRATARSEKTPFGPLILSDTLSGIENVRGTSSSTGGTGADSLYGNEVANFLDGLSGNDNLNGRGGNDWISAGPGNDLATGGDGADRINLDDGNDTAHGDDGDDTIDGGFGNDELHGGADNDELIGGPSDDVLRGGSGDDVYRYFFGASGGFDYVQDDGGSDRILAASPDSVIGLFNFSPDSGVETISGGGHGGVVVAIKARDSSNPLFRTGSIDLKDTHLDGIAAIRGSDSGDFIFASPGSDRIEGLGGNDTILGRSGDDSLFGGEGNDDLRGGKGSNTLDGGAGSDTASFARSGADPEGNLPVNASLVSNRAVHADGVDTLIEIENLGGSNGNDTLEGNNDANKLHGNEGIDLIWGRGGDDSLDGFLGNDTVVGDSGNDTVAGGEGVDLLIGGPGRDRFVFQDVYQSASFPLPSRPDSGDTIRDFEPGADIIDLSPIDADNRSISSNEAFTFVGTGPITGVGQIRFAAGVLQGNVNDDLVVDFEIFVQFAAELQEADFIL